MKKILLIGLCLLFLVGCSKNPENTKDILNETTKETAPNKESTTNKTKDSSECPLNIPNDWVWKSSENFTFVKGRVKNISNSPIEYYEVVAKYMDLEGNVLDSEYVFNSRTLLPNESEEFEIMKELNESYAQVGLFITNIVYE